MPVVWFTDFSMGELIRPFLSVRRKLGPITGCPGEYSGEEYDTKRDSDNESRASAHAADCRVSLHNAYQFHLRGLRIFRQPGPSSDEKYSIYLTEPIQYKGDIIPTKWQICDAEAFSPIMSPRGIILKSLLMEDKSSELKGFRSG